MATTENVDAGLKNYSIAFTTSSDQLDKRVQDLKTVLADLVGMGQGDEHARVLAIAGNYTGRDAFESYQKARSVRQIEEHGDIQTRAQAIVDALAAIGE